MRILFTIPHFFGPADSPARHGSQGHNAEARTRALSQCIASIHQQFGHSQSILNIAQRQVQAIPSDCLAEVHVVVCTLPDRHLLDQLTVDKSLFQHFVAGGEPLMLGFQCHKVLRDRWGNYDYYCFLEDDLILPDPSLFNKLSWFNKHVGDDKLLQPNRFECDSQAKHHKLYVDGDLRPDVTAPFQDVRVDPDLASEVLGQPVEFSRTLNPHSGCFFLNARQMQQWINRPFFLDEDTSFVGPLESAATLGIMRTFQVYKPTAKNASFLEVEHFGTAFRSLIK